MDYLPILYNSLIIFGTVTIITLVISYIIYKIKKIKADEKKEAQTVLSPQVKIVVQKSGGGKPSNPSLKQFENKKKSLPLKERKDRIQVLNKPIDQFNYNDDKNSNREYNDDDIFKRYDDNL